MGPQLKVVERTRTATMLCAASGNPDPEITWYKDFLPIDPSASNGRIKQLRSGKESQSMLLYFLFTNLSTCLIPQDIFGSRQHGCFCALQLKWFHCLVFSLPGGSFLGTEYGFSSPRVPRIYVILIFKKWKSPKVQIQHNTTTQCVDPIKLGCLLFKALEHHIVRVNSLDYNMRSIQ